MSGTTVHPPEPAYRLLVVDDVDDNRDLLSRFMRKRGFVVLTAVDGPSALRVLASEQVDLVILDVTMPGMSGIEVLREIRKTTPAGDLPVIMATARNASEHVVEALELGANDYVTKPIDFPVLHARIVATLRATAKVRKPGGGVVGPGTRLGGRYTLGAKIGEGNFGAVYRAEHVELQRPVAVKVLRSTHVGDEGLARFRREGITACRVQHPNALAILDSGVTDEGIAFLVMELLEGRTLEDELSHSWLSFARCAEVVAPVCEALAVAHAAGIVHRDVKPANIYLHRGATGDVPKVLDFGIAKLVGASVTEQRITIEGWIVGTPVYMAPERFSAGAITDRSDVYSVGVMLHQLISGDVPFAALTPTGVRHDDPIALATMHGHQAPPRLRQIEPDTPAALEELILAALAKRAEDRPSAAELAHALRAAVADAPPERSLMRRPLPARGRRSTEAHAMPTLPIRSGAGEGD